MPLVGPIALLVADWSRPQKGRGAMFIPALLDRLSVVHPALPTAVFVPAGLYLFTRSMRNGFGAGASLLLYVGGLLVWSLFEYLAHRGSFHREPKTEGQLAFAYLMHGVHHAYPDDSRRWMMPLTVSVPLAVAFYALFVVAFGRYGAGLFAGFVHGYLTYDLLHYFIHRGHMPTSVGRFLRRYHLAHHFARPDRHFGVSSPLWDLVFRTR